MSHPIDVHNEFASFFKDKDLEAAAYAVSLKLAEGHTCLDIESFNEELRVNDAQESLLNPIDIESLA
ncbi:MAG: hypothetical protein JEZ14_17940, partial [Marinilabiliaceae bacterium]|nr:hypothetical protein [Marinilabiliaceae bacterium]